MKKILILLAVILLVSCTKDSNNDAKQFIIPEGEALATTTYYLIRHAEKRRDSLAGRNPELNDKGFKRSKFWGEYFKDKDLDLFYTTDYMRTFQTMIPIVYPYKAKVAFYDARDTLFTKEIWENTYGKTSIIVGHSNTTPKFANEILGVEKYDNIPDTINHRLYKIVISKEGFVTTDTIINVMIK